MIRGSNIIKMKMKMNSYRFILWFMFIFNYKTETRPGRTTAKPQATKEH